MAVDARHRDKNGEISRKHGNTLIHTLRKTYGLSFAPGCTDHAKLSDVLGKLDELSLSPSHPRSRSREARTNLRRQSGKVQFLITLDVKSEWEAEKRLVRS